MESDFGVNFPLFSKIDVNGLNAHPLYRYLKSKASCLFGSERQIQKLLEHSSVHA
ncbi:hypothetical protein [Paenibacillus albus]|uniref:hypothetical protein n=1 Tax=Paenibacillus albus TaxID=2495582 RepID=UPI001D13145B|nr:hypothetical protein [Paenibacillus albus]